MPILQKKSKKIIVLACNSFCTVLVLDYFHHDLYFYGKRDLLNVFVVTLNIFVFWFEHRPLDT